MSKQESLTGVKCSMWSPARALLISWSMMTSKRFELVLVEIEKYIQEIPDKRKPLYTKMENII